MFGRQQNYTQKKSEYNREIWPLYYSYIDVNSTENRNMSEW